MHCHVDGPLPTVAVPAVGAGTTSITKSAKTDAFKAWITGYGRLCWKSVEVVLQHEIMCYHCYPLRAARESKYPSIMMFHRRFEYRSTELWLLGVRTTHCLSMVAQIYALPALWVHDEQHMLHPQLHDACKLEGCLPSISPSLPSPPSLPLAFLSCFFSSIFSLFLVLCFIFLCRSRDAVDSRQ